ncbi:MAG: type II secretion system F family protein [Methanocellales archaeon]|nr:type II secretion system F family protein [Methanocellales archaeon]
MKIEKFRMHVARYVQRIRLKYDIRREYFTVAIPVIAAIVLLCVAVLSGHTFPTTGGVRDVDDARLAAYAELVAELGEDVVQIEVPQKDEEIRDNLDHILVFAVLVAIIPYSVDAYIQKRLLKKREIAYSEFLFKLSELMRGGIDPIKGVIELSKTDLGAITGSIKGAASAMILGHSFADAMNNMAAAQKSEIIKKYTALVVRASYAGGAVADIVFRTSEDMRTVIRIEQEKEGDLKQYTIIFYFAQGIIVMLMYVLSTSLLPMIQGAGMGVLLGDVGVVDIDFRLGFFHMIIMNAFFGGLIIGQITEGNIKHGLKHSAVLMIVCYVASTALILPVPLAEPDITIEVLSGDG